jgi:hypothetical protein
MHTTEGPFAKQLGPMAVTLSATGRNGTCPSSTLIPANHHCGAVGPGLLARSTAWWFEVSRMGPGVPEVSLPGVMVEPSGNPRSATFVFQPGTGCTFMDDRSASFGGCHL